jgi:hypothetical protein
MISIVNYKEENDENGTADYSASSAAQGETQGRAQRGMSAAGLIRHLLEQHFKGKKAA